MHASVYLTNVMESFDDVVRDIQKISQSLPTESAQKSQNATATYTEDHYDTLLRRGFPVRCVTFLRNQSLKGPALETARNLWKSYITKQDTIIVLCGAPGTGKTMMATLWALHRLKKGWSCGFYRKTVDLLRELTDTFDTPTRESVILEKYQRTAYLVLDEYATVGNGWKNETLTNLLDHRYDNMLTTVIITNTHIDTFTSELHPAWLDRINHCGVIVNCDWESYRI